MLGVTHHVMSALDTTLRKGTKKKKKGVQYQKLQNFFEVICLFKACGSHMGKFPQHLDLNIYVMNHD